MIFHFFLIFRKILIIHFSLKIYHSTHLYGTSQEIFLILQFFLFHGTFSCLMCPHRDPPNIF